MATWQLDELWQQITVDHFLYAGWTLLLCCVLLAPRTAWAQRNPLQTCMILSLIAHFLLAGNLMQVSFQQVPQRPPKKIVVSRVEIEEEQSETSDGEKQQQEAPVWDQFTPPQGAADVKSLAQQHTVRRMSEDATLPSLPTKPVEVAIQEDSQTQPTIPELPDPPVEAPLPEAKAQQIAKSRSKEKPLVAKPLPQQKPKVNEHDLAEAQVPRQETSPLFETGMLSGDPQSLAKSQTHEEILAALSIESVGEPQPGEQDSQRTLRPQGSAQVSRRAIVKRSPLRRTSNALRPTTSTTITPMRISRTIPEEKPEAQIAKLSVPKVPQMYQRRVMENRRAQIAALGGSHSTETAVESALRWLAKVQEADGSWDAARWGAGREANVDGQDRRGAGGKADHAVTGLAVLAFLGAGHTHLDGPYQETVKRSLEFFQNTQDPSGHLAGEAALYEFMYCHAMASFALCEAYALTRDPQLLPSVRKAVSYTVRAQDPVGGSWRYQPGVSGDTSLLGWQVMILKSAKVAGVEIPQQTFERIEKYLEQVSLGKHGGLASYRPDERASRVMTAEAMFCRQTLGIPMSPAARDEAVASLLEELPNNHRPNLYYQYYATLALYHQQGPAWERWNEALQRSLLATQETQGTHAGSWPTTTVWGSHGGRIYSTSLNTLCLEVYYRFLPAAVSHVAGRESNELRR